ncbi:MAG: hypothetical protein KAI17_13780, partial [Thiotrichaceae bacterium]|nr:hypothetical protein [Thiotrichaceae bacterium]
MNRHLIIMLTIFSLYSNSAFSFNPFKIIKDVVTAPVRVGVEVVEETVEVIEDVADATGDAIETTVKATGKAIEGTADIAQATLDAGGAVLHIAVLDKDGAEKLIKKSGDNLTQGSEHLWDAGGGYLQAQIDLAKDGTDITTANFDSLLGTGFNAEYHRVQNRTSKEISRATQKMGVVLKVVTTPENLGKIAFLYAATAVGGPFGSALANVIYDKFILKIDMSEGDMLKSFAIGAAAGYAAESVQGLSEGKKALDATKHANYLSKMASSVTRNLATDVGGIALKGDSYSSKEFFKSLAGGLSVVEVGNGVGSAIFEATFEEALQETSNQAIDNNLDLSEIDFEKVNDALYKGMANGLTREAVHGLMDATVMKKLPESWKRYTLKAIEEMENFFYESMLSYKQYQNEQEQIAVLKEIAKMSDGDRLELIETMRMQDLKFRENIAQDIFGKSYSDLTAKEILSSKFEENYQEQMTKLGQQMLRYNPHFKSLVKICDEYGRNPAEAAFALEVAVRTVPSFTLIDGGLSAKSASGALNPVILRVLGIVGMLIYSPSAGEGSDIVSHEVQERNILPPSPDDERGWELYSRALKGDRAAAASYLSG